jgi:hypothetical protein
VCPFYQGEGVDASIENIHLIIDMFQEVSVAQLVRDFYLGEGADASIKTSISPLSHVSGGCQWPS